MLDKTPPASFALELPSLTNIKMSLEDVDLLRKDQLSEIEKFQSFLDNEYYRKIDSELDKMNVKLHSKRVKNSKTD